MSPKDTPEPPPPPWVSCGPRRLRSSSQGAAARNIAASPAALECAGPPPPPSRVRASGESPPPPRLTPRPIRGPSSSLGQRSAAAPSSSLGVAAPHPLVAWSLSINSALAHVVGRHVDCDGFPVGTGGRCHQDRFLGLHQGYARPTCSARRRAPASFPHPSWQYSRNLWIDDEGQAAGDADLASSTMARRPRRSDGSPPPFMSIRPEHSGPSCAREDGHSQKRDRLLLDGRETALEHLEKLRIPLAQRNSPRDNVAADFCRLGATRRRSRS